MLILPCRRPGSNHLHIICTDMRNGFYGLGAKVQAALKDDPMPEQEAMNRALQRYV